MRSMLFKNREEAAKLLAEKLVPYKGQHPLVLAIPRGAVPMAKIIAESLGGEVDVVLVRKLCAPSNPEYAIGAVDESGHVQMNEDAGYSANDPYVQEEVQRQMKTMQERRKLYSPTRPAPPERLSSRAGDGRIRRVRPPIDPRGRIVIVVDDGIATGSTMIAALRSLRAKKPTKLIVAIGVAPPDSLERLKGEADELVCLQAPTFFSAVGQFFEDFRQVSDEEVVRLLSGKR